jgi:site-specific DNA-methyltransferase (adenine-specific)
MNVIFNKTCEQMTELPNDSVQLIVTSPPYFNAIDYDVHVTDKAANYRPRQDTDYQEYLDFLTRCFGECWRVLAPNRMCAVVIGTVLLNGVHIPLPFHFVNLMERIGFSFHQDIVWYKVTGGVKRAGSVIQKPYPGYYYPNIMTEYILVFCKRSKEHPKMYESLSVEMKEQSRIPIDELFTRELANNIWHIAPVPPNQFDHPCAFPEELVRRLLLLYSYQGDLVLDPFMGIGTTAKVAKALKRQYVGYEIKEDYCRTAEARLRTPFKLRQQLISRFEKIKLDGQLKLSVG